MCLLFFLLKLLEFSTVYVLLVLPSFCLHNCTFMELIKYTCKVKRSAVNSGCQHTTVEVCVCDLLLCADQWRVRREDTRREKTLGIWQCVLV
jgi:hypothetical protein